MLEYSLHLDKGLGRSRWQEDDMSSRLLLKALADASLDSGAGALAPQEAQEVSSLLLGSIPSVSLEAAGGSAAPHEGGGQGGSAACGDRLEQAASQLPVVQQLERVLDGVSPLASFAGSSTAAGTQPSATIVPGLHDPFAREGRRVVLSGSFNPLHHGHTTLMTAALELVPSGVPCFEIAGVNADKGKIPAAELERRVSQFTAQDYLVVVTGEPLFAAKAELLPESTFVIGYDTAIRLINPKYYGDSEERMQGVLLGMGEHGCDFIVAPRLVAGDFRSFVDLSVPESLSHLFKGLDNFRVDISSTELRQKAKTSGL